MSTSVRLLILLVLLAFVDRSHATCLPQVSADAATLCNVLRQVSIPTCISRSAWHGWVDNAMADLTRREPRPAGVTETFIALIRNPGVDPVVRDYAVQHLTMTWVLRVGARERAEICAVVRECVANRAGTEAGTALLALRRMERAGIATGVESVAIKAGEVAADETAAPASRATALQILSEVAPQSAEIEARNLVSVQPSGVLARSAEAVLGKRACPTCPTSAGSP